MLFTGASAGNDQAAFSSYIEQDSEATCGNVEEVERTLRKALDDVNDGGKAGAVFLPSVHVFCHPQKGRGLKTPDKSLKKSDIFLRLPLRGLLNSQSLLDDRVTPVNHLDALALVVIEKAKLGKNAYISTLPLASGVQTAFRLCEDELVRRVKNEETLLLAREMRDLVTERAMELVERGFIKEEKEYVHALSVIQSRVFVIQRMKDDKWVKVPSLVMIADTLNLSLDPNTDCQTNEASTHFECYATRDIASDEELLAPFQHSQGDMDMNSYTWMHYGFEFSHDEVTSANLQHKEKNL
jgi:hypothetical protein